MSTDDTSDGAAPLIQFEADASAPVLEYDIPQPTSYTGRHYMQLNIPDSWFDSGTGEGVTYPEWIGDKTGIDVVDTVPDPARTEELAEKIGEMFVAGEPGPIGGDIDPRVTEVSEALRTLGKVTTPVTTDRSGTFFPSSESTSAPSMLSAFVDYAETPSLAGADSPTAGAAENTLADLSDRTGLETDALRRLQPMTVASQAMAGRMPVFRQSMGGTDLVEYVPAETEIEPKLMLVERHRLSSFLGDYGAGRTIKTFSLLPGEQTTISMETFRRDEERQAKASSILESRTEKSANRFEETVKKEQSHKEQHETSFSWHAEASGSANWGFGQAEVSGGVQGSTNSSRQSFARNVSSATSMHASEASSHREVQVDTSYEAASESGKRRSIEREIENINLSRTLNFVFRQMNQEFITLLHLVDVRVAYVDGSVSGGAGGPFGASPNYREVPLPELDSLLEDVIDPGHRDEVRGIIEGELANVLDHERNAVSVIETESWNNTDGDDIEYVRFDDELSQTYNDDTGAVDGVILNADRNIMRTEGVIVDALLGGAEALDDYSRGLQREEVREQSLENDRLQTTVDRERLGMDLVQSGDERDVDRYDEVFDEERERVYVDVEVEEEPERREPPERPEDE